MVVYLKHSFGNFGTTITHKIIKQLLLTTSFFNPGFINLLILSCISDSKLRGKFADRSVSPKLIVGFGLDVNGRANFICFLNHGHTTFFQLFKITILNKHSHAPCF